MGKRHPSERLQRFRLAHGYSQVELARLIGCHPSFVNKIEAGTRLPGAFAFEIEDLTALWVEGPIDAREWIPSSRRKAS